MEWRCLILLHNLRRSSFISLFNIHSSRLKWGGRRSHLSACPETPREQKAIVSHSNHQTDKGNLSSDHLLAPWAVHDMPSKNTAALKAHFETTSLLPQWFLLSASALVSVFKCQNQDRAVEDFCTVNIDEQIYWSVNIHSRNLTLAYLPSVLISISCMSQILNCSARLMPAVHRK